MYTRRQAHALQCRRPSIAAMISKEFCAVCRHTIRFTGGCQECHALSEIRAICVARQQCKMTRYKFRNDVGRCVLTRRAEYPLCVISDVDATHACAGIMKFQLDYF